MHFRCKKWCIKYSKWLGRENLQNFLLFYWIYLLGFWVEMRKYMASYFTCVWVRTFCLNRNHIGMGNIMWIRMQAHKEHHEKGRFIHLNCLSTHIPAYLIFLYGQYIVACFLQQSFSDCGKIIMCLLCNLLCLCKYFVDYILMQRHVFEVDIGWNKCRNFTFLCFTCYC